MPKPRGKQRSHAPFKKGNERVWRRRFIIAFRLTGNCSAAALAAGVSTTTVRRHREQDPQFAQDFQNALDDAADMLELEARRRAHDGVSKPVVSKGGLVMVWTDAEGKVLDNGDAAQPPGAVARVPLMVTEYSDGLLQFMLGGLKPERYRPKSARPDDTSDDERVIRVPHFIPRPEGGEAAAPAPEPPTDRP